MVCEVMDGRNSWRKTWAFRLSFVPTSCRYIKIKVVCVFRKLKKAWVFFVRYWLSLSPPLPEYGCLMRQGSWCITRIFMVSRWLWTQAAMRGESNWSVGERELFAAMTAKWNQCPFCIKAYGAIASLVLDKTLVQAAVDDSQQTKLPP